MSNLLNKPPLGLKFKKTQKSREHLARVAELPCVICKKFGLSQDSPTQVHHCIDGRHSNVKASDLDTIPLCEGHHQGNFDVSKIAIHRDRKGWNDAYGLDRDYIPQTLIRAAK